MSPELMSTEAAARTSLDAVVDALAAAGPQATFNTALRTRSGLARRATGRLASPDRAIDDLLDDLRSTGDTAAAIDPAYLYVLAGLLYSESRFGDSFAVYTLADRRSGGRVPAEHLTWYARSAFRSGADLDGLLERLTGLPGIDLLGLRADACHPAVTGAVEPWLERFRLLTDMPDLTLTDDEDLPFFDRLTTEPLPPVESGVTISIIMTSYRPGPEIRTAIRSVLAQTWQNWELLLVDDCSGPEFHGILAECAALDPRIKLILLPRNGGTYRARNRALAETTGRLVTGLDCDDWAHPAWLERQAAPILQDKTVILSISSAVRAFEDLTVSGSDRSIHSVRSTSIMFQAEPVRQHMGFFDDVRKGADTEFRMRFATVFGDHAIRRMTESPLAIVRLSSSSLTSSEFGMGWIHPYRWVYQSGQKLWHQQIRTKKADPYISAASPRRPFYAPAHLQRGVRDSGPFDEVHVVDARFDSEALEGALTAAADAADAGRRVAIIHQESLLEPLEDLRRLRPALLNALHEHRIAYLSPADEVETTRLIVADPSLWEGRQDEYRVRCLGKVEFGRGSAVPIAAAQRVPRQARAPKRPAPVVVVPAPERDPWGLRKPALLALAAVYALAVAACVLGGGAIAAVALFWALSLTCFGLILLGTAPGFRRLVSFLDRKLAR